jgi:hypothetical protein
MRVLSTRNLFAREALRTAPYGRTPTPPFWFAMANTFDTDRYRTFPLSLPYGHGLAARLTDIVTKVKVRSNCSSEMKLVLEFA